MANKFDRLGTWQFKIVLRLTGDGVTTSLTTVTKKEFNFIQVTAQCGPESTTITPPEIETLKQGEGYSYTLYATERFLSSNPSCPIITNSLTGGSWDRYWNFEDQVDRFTITLSDKANDRQGLLAQLNSEYEFIVTATAEGGATGTTTGIMEIIPGELPYYCLGCRTEGFIYCLKKEDLARGRCYANSEELEAQFQALIDGWPIVGPPSRFCFSDDGNQKFMQTPCFSFKEIEMDWCDEN